MRLCVSFFSDDILKYFMVFNALFNIPTHKTNAILGIKYTNGHILMSLLEKHL